jgi:hypothetical protein
MPRYDSTADEFFCWLSRIAASSKASRCYECMPETQDVLSETLEQWDLLCSSNEHSDVAWETANAVYKDFAGAKLAWCDLKGKGGS